MSTAVGFNSSLPYDYKSQQKKDPVEDIAEGLNDGAKGILQPYKDAGDTILAPFKAIGDKLDKVKEFFGMSSENNTGEIDIEG